MPITAEEVAIAVAQQIIRADNEKALKEKAETQVQVLTKENEVLKKQIDEFVRLSDKRKE